MWCLSEPRLVTGGRERETECETDRGEREECETERESKRERLGKREKGERQRGERDIHVDRDRNSVRQRERGERYPCMKEEK